MSGDFPPRDSLGVFLFIEECLQVPNELRNLEKAYPVNPLGRVALARACHALTRSLQGLRFGLAHFADNSGQDETGHEWHITDLAPARVFVVSLLAGSI